jgi:hypothetical protein
MRNKAFLAVLIFLMAACASGSKHSSGATSQFHLSGVLSKFSNQKLGESAADLKKNLGEPSETGAERYGSIEYQTLDYNSGDGAPLAYYTLNLNKEVVGKSVWIAKDLPESDLNWLLQNRFAEIKFETYTPCKTHGPQKMLIAKDQGLFVGVDGQRVVYISNCAPQLTDVRINQFEISCPQLQERGSAVK